MMRTDEENDNKAGFVRFVDRSLLLSMAPVIESFHIKIGRHSDADVGFWVSIAVERGLRELDFDYFECGFEPRRLPQSLFTCGTLVVLKLRNVSLVDVRFPVCFQLLKTLHLDYVLFLDDESPKTLLSSCPVLEVFHLTRDDDLDDVVTFSVMVPSLQRFFYCGGPELVMNTPSLKYLTLSEYGDKCSMIEYLPEIVEAYVQEVTCSNTDDILRSIASVKRLFLCLPSKPKFPTGSIFHRLQHLEFCTSESEWDLLMSMLQHSPKLRSLKLYEHHGCIVRDPMLHWEEPSSVPETLKFVLETFEWRKYKGWMIQKELATFILKHSRRLKIAIFSPDTTNLRKKHPLITELARLSRGSTECELVFG
ncbi:PREDICTED: FBD-associated F-box protein At5g56370-like [Camelina sativa]|uniref:FBD-associated F-box protein At5g56370-like n=1 Tax=Camelina sativa TaxID=90675 RepID=A0ABM1R008_CAMSA|nr:PREDICTED: FBD-associated F-box protein At5g56370-like [Camelina sativa]XP_019092346.1 PREDICTED: FBD-associated F-box protein At5g56370-like [Camelina sativa]